MLRSRGTPRLWSWRGAAMVALIWLSPNAAAAAAPQPGVPSSAELIVPLAKVQAIVGAPTLEVRLDADRTSPWVDHSRDAHLSAACQRHSNEDEEFGTTWVNFKSARYGAASNLGVRQAIAVYPNAEAARQTFAALKAAEHQCYSEHPADVISPGYTLNELDPSTLLEQYPDSVNGPGSVGIVALRGQVIVDVGAAHLSTDPRIALAVLALIAKKIG